MRPEDEKMEADAAAFLRRKLKREPTGWEVDAELARRYPTPKSTSLPYVCHCGRPDCTIDAENE